MDKLFFRNAVITSVFCATLVLITFLPTPARTQQGNGPVYLPATMVQGLSRTNISGKVYSVIDIDRVGIPNVRICIKHTGVCTLSDSNGNYRFDNSLAGSRILVADEIDPSTGEIDPNSDYSHFERTVYLVPQTENIIDILLNPKNLFEGGYRIVLSWNTSSEQQTVDLDANFWLPPGPADNPTGYHVTKYIDISNCQEEGSVGSGAQENNYNFTWPYAYIDVDNTTGSDIETISIGRLESGMSTFAVLHAQYAGIPGGEFISLADSNAVVELYDSTDLIATFQVPPSNVPPGEIDKSTWWHVFNIYDTGEIEVINELSGAYPIDSDTYTCQVVEP